MHLDATEVSGVTNGSIVTPSLAPPGFTGTVVVASGGSVNFAPAQLGNGVYFLNCCANNTAYYRFNGAAIGNIFNINQGQISFYLKSRYNLANRPTGARVVFDVRDGDPNNHLFHFVTDVATVGSERYLLFRYRVGNTAIPATTYVDYFFYVDDDVADTLFGNGVVLKVGITWDGSITKLFLNDVSVQTSSYTKTVPNWTGASIFDLGAYEYLNLGGYNSTDDIIDEFTVIGPGAPPPPSVTITAPANGATVSGTATVSANATSPAGMGTVQFLLDGGNLGSGVTGAGPSYSTSWDTTKTANGLHSISAVATDSAGLMTTSGSISVTVNNVSSPPVISGVGAGAITPTGATISWTTNTPSNSQVSYGTTTAYGSVNSNPALVTAHSIALSGLSPQTTYHYRVQSQDAQGLTAQSGDFTFTTVPTGGQQTLLQMHLDATEVSGVTNGAIVTPSVAPPGFTGTVVVASGGSVNFAPAQAGNGVYFLNCCATNTAYYRFNGAAIGNIFNINQGQISFYLKSRYSLANRPTGARVVFDVRDGDPNNHLFHFVTDVATVGSERYLLFRYRVGNTAIPATTYVDYFFYIDHDVADTLFGNGVALKVGITWDGSVTKLFLNDVNVQTSSYTKTVPNWSGASIFDLGAYEYLNLGGYNSTDDIIDEFTVIGPGV